ncbi:MAG: GreA/GreB family elongation factor [Bacteroidota bacterium]
MSKAFTKEDDGAVEPPVVAARALLPAGVPNYVTARGLRALRDELAALADGASDGARPRPITSEGGEASRRAAEAIELRRRDLDARIASAVLVDRPADVDGAGEVRFGARVQVRFASGIDRRYQIVGVDEANAAAGLIAFVSPMARALLGRRVGDTITVRTPGGEEDVELMDVSF